MKFGCRSKQHRDLELKTLVYASTRARRKSGERTHARCSGARRGGRNQFSHGLTNDNDVVVEAFVSNAWLGA